MKPFLHKVPMQQQTSFSIRHDIQPNFGTVWHYHPELELHYVIRGEGVRFVGDDISNFNAGELILLGQNLPHTWRCHSDYFKKEKAKETEAIVIQFLPEFLGQSFLNLPEARQLNHLFEKANKGLLIKGKTKKLLEPEIHKALEVTGLNRLVVLLRILEILAESTECEAIASTPASHESKITDYGRLNKIYNYTFAHYDKEIALDCISSACSVSQTYFCRYFKQMTGKTYHRFLTEIRVSIACRMLLEGDKTIEEVCYASGFNNLTNFFRYFKRLKGITPKAYRKKVL